MYNVRILPLILFTYYFCFISEIIILRISASQVSIGERISQGVQYNTCTFSFSMQGIILHVHIY